MDVDFIVADFSRSVGISMGNNVGVGRMTANLDKCKHCQTWKQTRGRGNKSCLKCNPFREQLKKMDLPAMDIVPDEVIEQYPDLQDGKIDEPARADREISESIQSLAHLRAAVRAQAEQSRRTK